MLTKYRSVAEKTQTPLEELYEAITWPLNRKYGHAIDAFKLSITYVLPFLCLTLGASY